jgi:predicted DNA-binding WGR domain protein
MANVSEGDSPSMHIVLERIDPVRNIARYYVLSIEPTLFAKHTLIRRWGRIGSSGRERLQFFRGRDASQAQVTLDTWLARKRKRGYAPRSEPTRPALLFHRRLQLKSLQLRSFNARESKNTSCSGWRRRSAGSATFCATSVIIWVSLNRIGSLSQDRDATRPDSKATVRTRLRLDCEPPLQSYEVSSASEDPLATQRSFGPDGLRRGHRCLRATLSSRFNPVLPAFSRTPFVAKDVAIEDSSCARGR